MTEVYIPLRTYSEPNMREHWARKARRTKRQRGAARLLVRAAHLHPPPTQNDISSGAALSVTLTRIAPRKLDDDNLAGALKAVRDGVADALGIDDGDERIRWRYSQGKGRPREYAVMVKVELCN